MRFSLLILLLTAALVACQEAGDELVGIDATGDLRSDVYLDRDGDGQRGAGDLPYPRLRVDVLPAGGGTPVATAVSDTLGVIRVRNLAVGSYLLRPDLATLGDTVHVTRIDSALVTVAANDSASALITIGYRTPTIAQITAMPGGIRVAISAIALNSWTTFGDSTVHLADSTGALRAVFVPPAPIAAGDRIRGTANLGNFQGVVALTDLTVVSRTAGTLPAPIDTTTSGAARAGGRLNSAQVRVRRAIVLEASSLPGGDVLFTVDDGSGALQVLVDANAAIGTEFPVTRGVELDVTGVLVPRNDGSGRWRLKPRFTGDVIVRYPAITIAAARALQPGQFVMIHGIALNEHLAFSDRSVHVADPDAAIRVVEVLTGFFSPGDSIGVFGEVAIESAGLQPVLRRAAITVLGRRVVPPPINMTPDRAATADNGQRDAALVRLSAVAFDTVRVSGELRHGFRQGTDFVEWRPPTPSIVLTLEAVYDVTGLLVPVAQGRWAIRPRTSADWIVH